MSNARLGLAFASERALETMFPLGAAFFLRAWGTSRFLAPLHAHRPESGR
jgi:hypothetical protein